MKLIREKRYIEDPLDLDKREFLKACDCVLKLILHTPGFSGFKKTGLRPMFIVKYAKGDVWLPAALCIMYAAMKITAPSEQFSKDDVMFAMTRTCHKYYTNITAASYLGEVKNILYETFPDWRNQGLLELKRYG